MGADTPAGGTPCPAGASITSEPLPDPTAASDGLSPNPGAGGDAALRPEGAAVPRPASDAVATADMAVPARQGDAGDRGVALLLAVAAVVAALITLVALNSSSDASSAWQTALRREVARGVAAVHDIRWVYDFEGPSAFQIAVQEVQAQEYRIASSSAAPEIRSQLEARAQVLEMTVDALRSSIELAVPAYALTGGGYDTLKRLSEQLSDPARTVYDPDGVMATGDLAAARADRLMVGIVAIGFAFLFGALAQAFRGARRPLLGLGWLALGVGIAMVLTGGLVL